MSNVAVLGLHDGAESGCNYYRLIQPFHQLRELGYDYDYMPMQRAPKSDAELKTLELAEKENWPQDRVDAELSAIAQIRENIERGIYQVNPRNDWLVPTEFAGKYHQIVNIVRPVFYETDSETGQPVKTGNYIRQMIDTLHEARTVVGGDFDDDFWTIEDHNPSKAGMGENNLDWLRTTVQNLDYVTCTSEFLGKRLIEETGINPDKLYLLPNLVDFDFYDDTEWKVRGSDGELRGVINFRELRRQRITADGRLAAKVDAGKPVTIGVQGGASHFADWQILAEVLPAVCRKWGDKVKIVVAGYHPDYLREALAGFSNVVWQGWRYFNFHAETVMSFDINLCPLRDSLFNLSKSPIKWVEASAAGAASVISPVVYGECVSPGLDALVVGYDSAEWFKAIDYLVSNPEKRRQIARNAHLVARATYDLKTNVGSYLATYEQIWAEHQPKVHTQWVLAKERRERERQLITV